MYTQRFGRKLKLPSTVAIKHGILKLMLQDHLKAQAQNAATAVAIDAEGRGIVAAEREQDLQVK
jgi:hypothetical protein